jgi:hypothetical protein
LYVDSWLETGRNADGSELPAKSQLEGRVFHEFWKYMEQSPPRFNPCFEGDGVGLDLARPVWIYTRNLFDATVVEARRMLVGMMFADWKFSVARCRYSLCGRYFLLARPNRSYRRGTFCCREHQRRASATIETRERRSQLHNLLIEMAAQQLLRWEVNGEEWADERQTKERLARILSRQILQSKEPILRAYRRPVKINWVTHNSREIEQRRRPLPKGAGRVTVRSR